MTTTEFERVWNLLSGLWPNASKPNRKRIWEIGLAPYGMDDCTNAIMEYARRSKYFPDLADVTAALVPEEIMKPESNAEMDAKHLRDIVQNFGSYDAYLDKLAGWIAALEAK